MEALASDVSNRNATKPLSFVTIGDGSVHNAHFLSSFNLASHARYRKKKCPVVFGVSDNGLSISYSTSGYADYIFSPSASQQQRGTLTPGAVAERDGVPVFKVNGCDMMDVYDKTLQATMYSRHYSAPSLVLYRELTRRFGHAATDRQAAYLNADAIESMAERDVVSSGIAQAIQLNALTYNEASTRFEEIREMVSCTIDACQSQTIFRHSGIFTSLMTVMIKVRDAFDVAVEEPKITSRNEMLERVSQPTVLVPHLPRVKLAGLQPQLSNDKRDKREVMRKHMTRVIAEVMEKDPKVVYIGEDVEHGGYYLVTDGLVKKFKGRVIDFPPDETTLLGAAMGFSQVGLLPIIEIPYAKYLDCGADMFYELAISNWLTNKQCPNGMVVRIQGFDRGRELILFAVNHTFASVLNISFSLVFGGNFHTHNMISHVPPGVDVVCYSNGQDYARGFRNAIIQARNGRVVVLIDCTYLLNLRHLYEKDRGWETAYPSEDEVMSFHDVRRFGNSAKDLIVTYGNGVVTALHARRSLAEQKVISNENELDIIDTPYISDIPDGLCDALSNGQYEKVLFCDICKEGPGSNVLSSTVMEMKKRGILPAKWDFVAAPRTYNPLGKTITFLNEEDIIRAYMTLRG
jgi:pyruvate/2-oxoglutarate/acetoin dehydrogenase E1 component